LFRLISYFTFASIVGGITAVVLTNYKSLDLALLVIIEIFFMAIFYWMTFILYKQENPNAKLATEIKFSRGIFKTNTKSGIYKKLKKNSAIERINGNEAIKRILKYLLVISILTGFYILVFYFLIPTPSLLEALK
jgi:sulfite exporter TauE/SafE